jgi:hypothetical protein
LPPILPPVRTIATSDHCTSLYIATSAHYCHKVGLHELWRQGTTIATSDHCTSLYIATSAHYCDHCTSFGGKARPLPQGRIARALEVRHKRPLHEPIPCHQCALLRPLHELWRQGTSDHCTSLYLATSANYCHKIGLHELWRQGTTIATSDHCTSLYIATSANYCDHCTSFGGKAQATIARAYALPPVRTIATR